ncbi:DUF418 domain-containing protein [Bacillus cereus]|uniref:DUF418 domain-containing protein n=1 Tax=Bacillus pseudomycoides TaxID=64104 RepID=UPI002FFD627C
MDKYRVSTVDGIRGFSLLGILLANMLIFQYGIFGKDEINFYSLSVTDLGAYKAVKVLIEGSFMPIFTFLFGYSMIKMKESLERKGVKVKRYFVRRFFFLFALGLLHAHFLWEGDILSFYGLMGFFLLLFLNRKKKTLIVWGIILLVLTSLMGYGHMEETAKEKEKMSHYIEKTKKVYGSGSYAEIKDHRLNEDPLDLPDAFYLFALLFLPFMSAPLFLFGMYAAKVNWFANPIKERSLYRKGIFIFLPIGLVLKLMPYLAPENDWIGVGDMLGKNLLSLGYIFLFAYFYTKLPKWMLRGAFENIGKLSLTNYLMQTVICTSIFYGYGLGQFGKMGMILSVILAIAIYATQAVASHYYLRRFNRGPVETLLRMWTNFSWNGHAQGKEVLTVKEGSRKVEGI